MSLAQLLAITLLVVPCLEAQVDSVRRAPRPTLHDRTPRRERALGLSSLATTQANGRELRLWYGFGIFGTGVIRLWEDGATWRICLHPSGGTVETLPRVRSDSRIPSDSVAATWDAVVAAGMQNLPRIPNRGVDSSFVLDGHSWILEWHDGKTYGVAEADNPAHHRSADDQRLEQIVALIWDRWRQKPLPPCR